MIEVLRYIYTSDRGDNFAVDKMETSHLVNVIGHHRAQIRTLEAIYEEHPHPALRARIDMLRETMYTLIDELVKRPVEEDEYITYLESAD